MPGRGRVLGEGRVRHRINADEAKKFRLLIVLEAVIRKPANEGASCLHDARKDRRCRHDMRRR